MKRLPFLAFVRPIFPRCRPVACTAWLALAMLLSGTTAFADPVRIVTSGGFSQIPEDGETGFSLFGPGFAITGGDLSATFSDNCTPCIPGSTLNLSATMSPSTFQPQASAIVDGTTYGSVFLTGDFIIDAGSVVVPDIPPGTFDVRVGTGFTFTGTLEGFADSTQTGTPFFSLLLSGSGTGSVSFHNLAASPGIYRDGFNYEFEQAAPVPEPGSIFLVGSGAVWIAARWRHRRRETAIEV